MKAFLVLAAIGLAAPAPASELPNVSAFDPAGAEIVILGEIHDNPVHHRNQAAIVTAMRPSALVFEMLDADQAARANGMARADASALEKALDWEGSGWPDFSLYHPIFLAAGPVPIYGAAVSREDLTAAMSKGAAAVFGPRAAHFALGPLTEADQAAREALQMEVHCNALPADMLQGMVESQRLRDASFSAVALRALQETGGPIAVITGNGHARRDWGMPAHLAAASPGTRVVTLAQFEEAAPEGDIPYDFWLITAAAKREDPCAAFARPAGSQP